MIDQLLALMIEKRASDLFLTVGAPIGIKIQGTIVPINADQPLTDDWVRKLVYSCISEEQTLQLAEHRELNLSFARAGGRFRLSAFYQKGHISAVLRYVAQKIPSLDELRLPAMLSEIAAYKRGLVMIVGATGCGKSSTIAAMLQHRNEHAGGHILTIEDPIEYAFESKKAFFNQREVGGDTDSLQIALKNALRQAPDVLFIGEIRDAASMSAAITYALSGHLVVTTLHANNSYHALSRIVSMYPADNRESVLSDLASALKAIVAQRLVRAKSGARMPAVELMLNNQLTADLIEKGKLIEVREAIEKSLTKGTQTFDQALLAMVNSGLLDAKEALAAADSATNLTWLMNNQGVEKAAEAAAAPIVRDASSTEYKEFSFK